MRAGRTVVFAGTALAVGMLGAFFIAPGSLLESATLGRGRRLRARGRDRAVRDPGRPRGARDQRQPLAAVVGQRREPVGAPVRARVAQARGGGAADDVPAAAALRSRAGARHRAAERRRTCRPTTRRERASRPSSATAARDGRRRSRSTSRPRARSRPRQRLRRLKRFQQRGRPATRDRGGPGPGLAARAHCGVAQPDPTDRVGRTPADRASRAGSSGCCSRHGAPEPGPRRGRCRRRRAERRPRAGSRRLRARSREGTSDAVPQTQRLADGVAQTEAGAKQLEPCGAAGEPGRARAATTRSTSWRG